MSIRPLEELLWRTGGLHAEADEENREPDTRDQQHGGKQTLDPSSAPARLIHKDRVAAHDPIARPSQLLTNATTKM
jgi:hypothetical protein